MAKLLRFRDLINEPGELSFLWEGIIPAAGFTYFVGPPKIGKSSLAIQLCDALEAGETLLGRKTQKTRCLYVQADVGKAIWKDQVKRVSGKGESWTLIDVPTAALDYQEHMEVLQKCVEISKPGFVVWDCLNKLTHRDINTKPIMLAITALYTLCPETPFLLIHHPALEGRKGVASAAGYHGITAACDNYINLRRNALVIEGGRVTKRQEIPVEQDEEGKWVLAGTSSDMDFEIDL